LAKCIWKTKATATSFIITAKDETFHILQLSFASLVFSFYWCFHDSGHGSSSCYSDIAIHVQYTTIGYHFLECVFHSSSSNSSFETSIIHNILSTLEQQPPIPSSSSSTTAFRLGKFSIQQQEEGEHHHRSIYSSI
jgi:hypothetical protein